MKSRVIAISLFAFISPVLFQLPLNAEIVYKKRVNIITSDYDLLDTTYIDRGRIDRVKVGDKFEVSSRNGKTVTQVVVTGVFDRMSSVKIIDSSLLKDGQIAAFKTNPEMLAFQNPMRRPAPDITVNPKKESNGAPAANPTSGTAATPAVAPAATAPAMPTGPDAPAAPGAPATPDAGLPPAPGAPAAGLPAAPDAPAAGLPSAPGAGLPPAPGAPAAGLPSAPGAGLPPAPGAPAAGLPAAPDAGLPPAPGAPAVPTDTPPDVPAPPAF